MRFIGCFVLMWLAFSLKGQTFSGGGGGILDNGAPAYFGLNVSGLSPALLDTAHGLKTVCVDVTHPGVGQLGIFLKSPDNVLVELSTGNGGNGSNLSGTCFSMGASQLIGTGAAPFTGDYYPEHNIGNCNNGTNGNGLWQLIVQDLVPGDSGLLNSWSLEFGTTAPAPTTSPAGPCDEFHPQNCVSSCGFADSCPLLPDVFISEKFLTDTFYNEEYFNHYDVTTATCNIGPGPLMLIGSGQWFCGDTPVNGNVLCSDGSWSRQLVYQRVYVKTSDDFFEFTDRPAGYMSYHSELGHQHLHFENWVENTLRIRGENSHPATWPVVGAGSKVSFCVYDHLICEAGFQSCTYNQQLFLFNNIPNRGLGIGFDGCGHAVQGMSVGYSDVYDLNLPGQSIMFDSICNGDYFIVSQFDPLHALLDADTQNNITVVPVTLGKQLAGCCSTRMKVDTLSFENGSFYFLDRSVPMPAQWMWSFGDGHISEDQFTYHTYEQPGIYDVVLITTNAQGCTDSVHVVLHVPVVNGLAFTVFEQHYRVVPNPSSGMFQLISARPFSQGAGLQVVDAAGSTVLSEPLVSGNHTFAFVLQRRGVYLLRLMLGAETFFQKLIVL